MKILIAKLHIFSIGFFLLFGNALRFLPIQGTFGSINFGEVIVYTTGVLAFMVYWKTAVKVKMLWFLLGITFYSLITGILKNGMDGIGIAYNLRLSALIVSSVTLGISLCKWRGEAKKSILNPLLTTYFFTAFFALILLAAFPDAQLLWFALADAGVEFAGDPHTGRLVSLYFDPNFYGAIVSLPLLLSIFSYFKFRRNRYIAIGSLFLVCLLLTVSRSGILIFGLALIWISKTPVLKFFNRPKITDRGVLVFLFMLIFTTTLAIANLSTIERIQERIITVRDDDSAGARLESANVANILIAQEPITGFGYHFSMSAVEKHRNGFIIDSSLQLLLVDFGALGSLLLLFGSIIFFFNLRQKFRRNSQTLLAEEDRLLYSVILPYLWICLLVGSNFNNILFYPFWLIPILAICTFFSVKLDKQVTSR